LKQEFKLKVVDRLKRLENSHFDDDDDFRDNEKSKEKKGKRRGTTEKFLNFGTLPSLC
jgi:hypothetical protein